MSTAAKIVRSITSMLIVEANWVSLIYIVIFESQNPDRFTDNVLKSETSLTTPPGPWTKTTLATRPNLTPKLRTQ